MCNIKGALDIVLDFVHIASSFVLYKNDVWRILSYDIVSYKQYMILKKLSNMIWWNTVSYDAIQYHILSYDIKMYCSMIQNRIRTYDSMSFCIIWYDNVLHNLKHSGIASYDTMFYCITGVYDIKQWHNTYFFI